MRDIFRQYVTNNFIQYILDFVACSPKVFKTQQIHLNSVTGYNDINLGSSKLGKMEVKFEILSAAKTLK